MDKIRRHLKIIWRKVQQKWNVAREEIIDIRDTIGGTLATSGNMGRLIMLVGMKVAVVVEAVAKSHSQVAVLLLDSEVQAAQEFVIVAEDPGTLLGNI